MRPHWKATKPVKRSKKETKSRKARKAKELTAKVCSNWRCRPLSAWAKLCHWLWWLAICSRRESTAASSSLRGAPLVASLELATQVRCG